MGTRKITRRRNGALTSSRPILRDYSTKELAELSEPHPWPVRDRKGNRAAHKALTAAIDQLADRACTVAFNASFAESMRLKYPRQSTRHFLHMFFRAMNKNLGERMRGAGVRP